MGQLLSSEEEVPQVKDAFGSLLYNVMLEDGGVPDLRVVHPFLLANHDESFDCQARLKEQLQQVNTIFTRQYKRVMVVLSVRRPAAFDFKLRKLTGH